MQQSRLISTNYKITSYIMTLLISLGYISLFGITSRLKKVVADDFSISQTILGLGDNLSYLGRFVGSLYLFLTPPKQLKQDLIFHSFAAIFFMESIALGKLIPSFGKQIYIVGMLLGGFSRAYIMLPWLILIGILGNSRIQRFLMSVWYGLSFVGDALGVLEMELLLVNLELSWPISLSICMGIFLILVLIFAITINEVSLQEDNQDHTIAGLINSAKNFFAKLSNCLAILQFVTLGNLYYMILLWLPFYLQSIGFEGLSSLISACFPAAMMIGIPFFYLVTLKIKNVGIIVVLFLCIDLIICFILKDLRDDPESKLSYFVLILLLGLFISGPEVRIITEDMKNRASTGHQAFIFYMIGRLIMLFGGGLILLLCGYLLSKNIYSFFVYVIILLGISLILQIIRSYLYPNQFQMLPQNEEEEKQMESNKMESDI